MMAAESVSPSSVAYTGHIIKRKLGKGSQKEKLVNAILTEQGMDIVVRHKETTAFQDAEFDALEGKRVHISGIMQSYVLVVDDCCANEDVSVSIANPNTERENKP